MARGGPPPTGRAGEVLRHLEAFGLTGYEARILLELLRAGSATAPQLATLSGVPRTSTYQTLERLRSRGLVTQLSGESGMWASLGLNEVLDRLYGEQEDRLRELRASAEEARAGLAELIPETPAVALPFVRFLPSPSQAKRAFDQIVAEARHELVSFSRPPYAWYKGYVNPVVTEASARKLSMRAIYPRDVLEDPDEARRAEIEAYLRGGVEARVADALPIKLVVADRAVALVAIPEPVPVHTAFPTVVLYEHPGMASVLADGFERCWAAARPYEPARTLSP